ncbi:hypothetical protein ACFVFJ_26935 [Streptomyces sp. NPDC057717]|uniref:hypothetical protein n=1 Tax=unclassified Streptomyces TaxID=2593676 RepID=UPI00366086B4
MSVPIPRVIVPTVLVLKVLVPTVLVLEVLVPRVLVLKVLVPTPPGPRPAKVPQPACTPWTRRVRSGGSCSSGSSTSS